MRLIKNFATFLFIAAIFFWGSKAAFADPPVTSLTIASKTYGTAGDHVAWGLPVLFDASGSFDPDGEALSFSWDFGDGQTASGGPTIEHQYTFTGLPAHCVPSGAGDFPPDRCPDPADPVDPAPLTVTLTVEDESGNTAIATVNLRLRRQQGAPLTDGGERQDLEAAIASAQAALDPFVRAEDNALRELDEAIETIFNARLEVLLSKVSSGLAQLKRVTNEDERTLGSFMKAIKALDNSDTPDGVAQEIALTQALRDAVDALLNRVKELDPCCDKSLRQAREKFGRGVSAMAEDDFGDAADKFVSAYSKIKGVRLPLGIPSDIPPTTSGAPLLEDERAMVEDAVSNVLAQLGTSSEERSAARNLKDALSKFGDARTEELLLNFKNAAKRDERALKGVAKGVNDLRKASGTENIQYGLALALRDAVHAAVQRAQAVFGTNPLDPEGKKVLRALENFTRGQANLGRDRFNSASKNFVKAYGRMKSLPLSP